MYSPYAAYFPYAPRGKGKGGGKGGGRGGRIREKVCPPFFIIGAARLWREVVRVYASGPLPPCVAP